MVFSLELTWPTSAVTVLLRAHPRLPPIQSKSSSIHETCFHHPSFSQTDAMLFELLQLKFQMLSTKCPNCYEQVRLRSPSEGAVHNTIKVIYDALDCCSSGLCLETSASSCDRSRTCVPMPWATVLLCTQDSLQHRRIFQHVSIALRALCHCLCQNIFMVVAGTPATILNLVATSLSCS
jgi:hypothetical protein